MHYEVALTAYRNVVVLPIISEKRSNRVSVMFMVIVTGHIRHAMFESERFVHLIL